MREGTINPDAQATIMSVGEGPMVEVWYNDLYECQVRYLGATRGQTLHLSIKLHTRAPVRDWRHFQAIKNEVAGWEREAIELFPAESRLVDGANQYHLFVVPAGEKVAVGCHERAVGTQADMEAELRSRGIDPQKGRQRDWQPGISTGPDYRPST
jgi:hypothetical protein